MVETTSSPAITRGNRNKKGGFHTKYFKASILSLKHSHISFCPSSTLIFHFLSCLMKFISKDYISNFSDEFKNHFNLWQSCYAIWKSEYSKCSLYYFNLYRILQKFNQRFISALYLFERRKWSSLLSLILVINFVTWPGLMVIVSRSLLIVRSGFGHS